MTTAQGYFAYEPSGIEWIGRFPLTWSRTRLGYHVDFITGFPFKSDSFSLESGVKLVRGDNVTEGQLRWGDKTRFWPVVTEDIRRYLLEAGDILIGMDGSKVGKNFAMVADADLPLLLVQRVARLRTRMSLSRDYLRYLIGSELFRTWTALVKTDPAIPHISPDNIKGFPIVLPSEVEQEQVVQFLNNETAKIDALIEKQQQLIGLLKEKRQAVISHAVTKGLNPDAPMRESGVEWLGEVPAHWKVGKLKYFAELRSGHTPSRSEVKYWDNCYIPWFSLADVWQIRDGRQIYLGETSETISDLGLANSAADLLPAGTVVLSRTASVGFSGIMPVQMATTQDFANWIPGESLLSEYLLFLFRSMSAEFDRLKMGSTHKTIYMPDIQQFSCPVAPIDEQEGIVAYLKGVLSKLDCATDRADEVIGLLVERRAALISAAVTGKIDVRGWKPPEAASEPASA